MGDEVKKLFGVDFIRQDGVLKLVRVEVTVSDVVNFKDCIDEVWRMVEGVCDHYIIGNTINPYLDYIKLDLVGRGVSEECFITPMHSARSANSPFRSIMKVLDCSPSSRCSSSVNALLNLVSIMLKSSDNPFSNSSKSVPVCRCFDKVEPLSN